MPLYLSESAKTSIAFKKLIGRNYAASDNAYYQEQAGGGFNVHSKEVWTQDVSTAALTGEDTVHEVWYDYNTAEASGALKLTENASIANKKAWNAINTASSTVNLTDWIPPKYGSFYEVKLYSDNGTGTAKSTQIFTTDNMKWFFDYEQGVLTLENTPTCTTPFWIEAYRYSGRKYGVQSIKTTASSSLITDITLEEGANIELSVTSNTITIAATAVGGGTTHAILSSATHTDSETVAPTRGDLITAQDINSTSLWSALNLGYDGYYLKSDGSDAVWSDIPLSGLSDVDPTGPAEGDALVYSTSGTWKPKTLSTGGYAINVEEEGAAKINTSASHGYLSFDGTDFNVTTGSGTCATVTIVDDGHDHTKFDNLSISANVSVAGTLYVCGSATFQSNLEISGTVSIDGTAIVSSLDVTANASVGGTLHVCGATTLIGNVSVSGTLHTSGAATFGSTVNISGAVSIANTLHVCSNATISGTLSVGGNISASGLLYTTSEYTVGQLMVSTSGNTAVNAWRLKIVSNDLTLQRYDSGVWTVKFTFGE